MAFLGGILGDLLKPAKDLVSEVIVDVDKKRELEYNLQIKEAELEASLQKIIHEEVLLRPTKWHPSSALQNESASTGLSGRAGVMRARGGSSRR